MSDIESQSSSSNQRVRDFFVPGSTELGAYLLISIILLISYNAKNLISTLQNRFLDIPASSSGTDLSSTFDKFNDFFGGVISGRLTQILFWAFVGSTIYMIIWFVKNILVSFRNDVVADHFAHPASYSRLSYWESTLAKKVFLFAITIVFFTYVSICLGLVLPALSSLALVALYDISFPATAVELVFALVGTGTVIYLFVLLIKTISHTWKVI